MKAGNLELEKKTVDIELKYYGMMCSCPQWATKQDIKLYEIALGSKNEIPLDSLFIIIEPENINTINPFELEHNEDYTFIFSGRFYQKKQKWINEEGKEFNSRVLKYEKCKIPE